MVGVAQLVRAPGCGPGGRGFKSHHSPKFSGYSVVRLTRLLWEQEIGSSNLSTPTLEEPISSSQKPCQMMRLLFFIYNHIYSSIPKSRTKKVVHNPYRRMRFYVPSLIRIPHKAFEKKVRGFLFVG